ncbi:hypothetical protein B5S33_g127 [[Candida] boidinii]|nr:hypothetical protein B5S30_g159 [[Candida] boidinii]OWB81510.1 hypothetical protein B5S33_g127 [[Candida] boidinii]
MEGGEHRTSELNAQRKKGADETLTSSALERMSIGVEEEHIEQREQVPYQPMRMHGEKVAAKALPQDDSIETSFSAEDSGPLKNYVIPCHLVSSHVISFYLE